MLNLIFFIFVGLVLNYLTVFFYEKYKLNHSKYSSSHQTHIGQIPRTGGISLYILFFMLSIYQVLISKDFFLVSIALAFIPALIVSIREDLFLNVSPIKRLLAIVFSSSLLVVFAGINLNDIQTPLIDSLLNSKLGLTLFTIFFLTALTNSFNVIDGLNGLCSLTFIAINVSSLIISWYVQDLWALKISIILIFFPLSFLVFNFPYARFFLGDSGAYFLGFISTSILIKIASSNIFLPKWLFILVLSYPFFEIIFSIIRKVILGRSPFYPDREHMHIIMYDHSKNLFGDTKRINPISTIFLIPIWGLPTYFVYCNLYGGIPIFNLISFYLFFYLFYYLFIRLHLIENKLK
jgi:UDP-N-acetylmuramyl pentapeptide phosphotransferase/UDP-N-acetylglucosamine-1-phosphate transferase